MKNNILITLLCALVSSLSFGQQAPDTLFANEREVLSVFFDRPIKKAITGAPHFAFTFNRESKESLGLLQATPGDPSNLLVLTQGDGVYSFVLSYRDSLSAFTRFVDSTAQINRTPTLLNLPSTIEKTPEGVRAICEQMLKADLAMHTQKDEQGMILSLSDPFYHEDYAYIRYRLLNTTRINYELESFTLYRILGDRARKASLQVLPLAPSYAHNYPAEIAQAVTGDFVLVYPKFTLGAHESLQVVLREKRGNRNCTYKIGKLD